MVLIQKRTKLKNILVKFQQCSWKSINLLKVKLQIL
jgi:hypothetical protein